MDILIKGMKMKDYPQSITINPDGSVIKDTFGLHRPVEEWKAIELPPHGRLIDADELVGNISDTYCEECPRTKPIMCRSCEYEDIMDDIENAPVVLERTT